MVLNLGMYKEIKNCVAEIKNAFWMVGSAFGTGYDLVYLYPYMYTPPT